MTEKLENKAIIIIGAGHFGQRAAALLKAVPHTSLWIVERDIPTLKKLGTMGAKRIAEDGVRFLAKHFSHLAPSTFIIPAVPVHLAFEWLRTYMNEKGTVATVPVPKSFGLRLPHTWDGSEGSLLISYADFRCPADCPEPANRCTVTGKSERNPAVQASGRGSASGISHACDPEPPIGPWRGGVSSEGFERSSREGFRGQEGEVDGGNGLQMPRNGDCAAGRSLESKEERSCSLRRISWWPSQRSWTSG